MTDEEKKAAEANALATAQEEERKKKEAEAAATALTPEQEKIAELEAEKAAILEREANYKVAYLKEVEKNKNLGADEESEEDRIRRITREELAQREIARIDTEKEELFKKTLKENKELKLAIQNKIPGSATGGGASTEQPAVHDTLVTPEQLAAFKARGWTDKDIERYKKNLQRYR
jgi:hypothetical protein